MIKTWLTLNLAHLNLTLVHGPTGKKGSMDLKTDFVFWYDTAFYISRKEM